jgi:hypothetical protein
VRHGCDLHAGVTVAGDDRRRLEQLCRYLLRPPISQERLTLRPDGSVVVALKIAWRDGTTHLHFEPLTLLERLAVLTPPPRINVLIYHGVLAPRAAWRTAAVGYGRPAPPARLDDRALPADPVAKAAPPPAAVPGAALDPLVAQRSPRPCTRACAPGCRSRPSTRRPARGR